MTQDQPFCHAFQAKNRLDAAGDQFLHAGVVIGVAAAIAVVAEQDADVGVGKKATNPGGFVLGAARGQDRLFVRLAVEQFGQPADSVAVEERRGDVLRVDFRGGRFGEPGAEVLQVLCDTFAQEGVRVVVDDGNRSQVHDVSPVLHLVAHQNLYRWCLISKSTSSAAKAWYSERLTAM